MIRPASALLLTLSIGLPRGATAQRGAGEGGGTAPDSAVVAPASPADPSCRATVNLPPEHFAARAVRRAESLGLLTTPLPSRSPLSLAVVAGALEEARLAARGRSPVVERLAEGWQREFQREFPGMRGACERSPRLLHADAGVGARRSRGRAAPGWAQYPPERTGARALEPVGGPVVAADVQLQLLPGVGLDVAPAAGAGPDGLRRALLAAALGPATLSIGREPVGYGLGSGGNLILSGTTALDRVEVKRDAATRLPGWLGVLGPVSYEAFLARLEEPDTLRSPYFLGTSVTLAPVPRLSVSLHRAIMFGGDEGRFRTTLPQLLRTLAGGLGGLGYENQILSAEGRLRLPTDSLLPLTAYLQWGMEDAAGGWRDVPGRVVGLLAPAVPGYPPLQLGVEYAALVHSCCGNSPWYRHWAFPAAWALGDVPLGHPLGGNGHEWRAYADLDEPRGAVHLSAALYYRSRGDENLYVPGRVRSIGFSLGSSWRLLDPVDARVSLSHEAGSSWSESDARAGLTVYLK